MMAGHCHNSYAIFYSPIERLPMPQLEFHHALFFLEKRDLCTRLDLLRPDRKSHVFHKQSLQKDLHDQKAQDRSWFIGQNVFVRNLQPGPDWIMGVIVERLGPMSYLVETETHQFWKHHADQLKEVVDSPLTSDEFRVVPDWEYTEPTPPSVNQPTGLSSDSATDSESTSHSSADVTDSTCSENLSETLATPPETRSTAILDQPSATPVSPLVVIVQEPCPSFHFIYILLLSLEPAYLILISDLEFFLSWNITPEEGQPHSLQSLCQNSAVFWRERA